MVDQPYPQPSMRWPTPGTVLELLKPVTWFPPMWAFACGAVSAGIPLERWAYIVAGMILAGPLICGTSQAVNDWFDRHVDAINEPNRVIPSGRMPGRSGLLVAIAGTLLSLGVAALLGSWVFVAACLGLVMAWAYSAPPLRFKMNGWVGNAAVGFSYESLPWLTAAAAATGAFPRADIFLVAVLYGLGAHGILTLNDFKAIEGDTQLGVRSLPVQYGVRPAARIACLFMFAAQFAVVGLLAIWENPVAAVSVGALLVIQAVCMIRLVSDPVRYAVWYSAIGVGLYVTGMMITAVALAPGA